MMLKFEKQAVKQIENLDKSMKARVKAGIDGLPLGDIEKLQGYVSTYRLRVGRYRVIYELFYEGIIIKAVLHRSVAYKVLRRF